MGAGCAGRKAEGVTNGRGRYEVVVKVPIAIKVVGVRAASVEEAARKAGDAAIEVITRTNIGPLLNRLVAEANGRVQYAEYQDDPIVEMLVDTLDEQGNFIEGLSVWVDAEGRPLDK
jgi:hypothetical protein